jgi:hypothetical protein
VIFLFAIRKIEGVAKQALVLQRQLLQNRI